MITYTELLTTPEYWVTKIQLDLSSMIKKYMETNKMSRTDLANKLGVTPKYISLILNGNFDHKLSKLVELSMAIDLVPQINYVPMEKLNEKNT